MTQYISVYGLSNEICIELAFKRYMLTTIFIAQLLNNSHFLT